MSLQLRRVSFFRLPMRTRFPFRYGIAALTELPHLFVEVLVELDGELTAGMSADGLPPKWFTKNPDTTFEADDLPGMCAAIRSAGAIGCNAGRRDSFFDWWNAVCQEQKAWSHRNNVPALLAGFGFSLIERAVLDAFCRSRGQSLHRVLQENLLQLDLPALRRLPAGLQPKDFLPELPKRRLLVRHTVGLGDPITEADTVAQDAPRDGLPFTLEENIKRYGLTHFKVKLSGAFDCDHDRLRKLAEVIIDKVGLNARFTLDGNENYRNFTQFREQWENHRADSVVRDFISKCMLFVEQPIHRDSAFDESIQDELAGWDDAPAVIIDESDCDFDSFPTARRLGYSGTSHKNCKGVVKSLANAASVAVAREAGDALILSAEDLVNVGPVALLQDLAMVASLGIEHVERNGHHYLAGLSQMPLREQERTLRLHSDLYDNSNTAFPSLRINQGMIQLDSAVDAPLGVAEHPDVSLFESWDL